MLWGAAAAAVYVAAALLLAPAWLVRPIFDGLAPPVPYRFVSPPPALAGQNQPPQPGSGTIDLTGSVSAATSVSTGDGQMQVVVPKSAFAPRPGEASVVVRIVPLAPPGPAGLAGGLVVTGNAYRVTADYSASRSPAPPRAEVTLVLRYPAQAETMVRRAGDGWTRLRSQTSKASLQLFASSGRLGVFAAAGRPPHGRTWLPYAAAAAGVAAGIFGYAQGVRSARRKRSA